MSIVKKFLHRIVYGLVGVFMLLFLLYCLFLSPSIQSSLIHRISSYIYSETGVFVQIGKVDFRPLHSLALKDVLVKDGEKDTLMACKTISLEMDSLSIWNRRFVVTMIDFDALFFNLKMFRQDSSSVMNVEVLLDSLSKLSSPRKHDSESSWDVGLQKITIRNSRFLYSEDEKDTVRYGVNWSDIVCDDLNICLSNFDLRDSISRVRVEHLSLKEKSGLVIKELLGDVTVKEGCFEVDNGRIALSESDLDLTKLKYTWRPNEHAWRGFVDKIYQYYEFKSSPISFKDLAYFNDRLLGMENIVRCEGVVFNTVRNIEGKDLRVELGDATILRGSFTSQGLPRVSDTYFKIHLHTSRLGIEDLEQIYLPWMDYQVRIPSVVHKLKSVDFAKLDFNGTIEDFVLATEAKDFNVKGTINFSLKEKQDIADSLSTVYDLKGDVNLSDLNMRLLSSSLFLNRAAVKGEYQGMWQDDLVLSVDGTVGRMDVGESELRDVLFLCSVDGDDWNADVSMVHPDDKLIVNSKCIANRIASKGKVVVDSLGRFFPINSVLSGKLAFDYHYDERVGEDSVLAHIVRLDSIKYVLANRTCDIDSLVVNYSLNSRDSIYGYVRSDLVNARLQSNYSGTAYDAVLKKLFNLYLKDDIAFSVPKQIEQLSPLRLDCSVELIRPNKLLSVIFPDLSVSGGVSFDAIIDEQNHTTDICLRTDSINYKGFEFSQSSFFVEGNEHRLVATLDFPRIKYGSNFNVYNLENRLLYQDNQLATSIGWNNSDLSYSGSISSISTILKNVADELEMETKMLPGEIIVGDTLWNISPATIVWTPNAVSIDSLSVFHSNQSLLLKGRLSEDDNDRMQMVLSDLNVGFWTSYFFEKPIQGVISGEMIYKKSKTYSYVLSDVHVSDFGYSDVLFGELNVGSFWNGSHDMLNLKVDNICDNSVPLSLSGSYSPIKDSLSLVLAIDSVNVSKISPFVDGYISDFSGYLSGKMNISGQLYSPLFSGKVSLDSVGMQVKQTHTNLMVNDTFNIVDNTIRMHDFIIHDVTNGVAVVSLNYDLTKRIYDLDTRFDKFSLFDIKESDNMGVYGDLHLSGRVLAKSEPNRPLDLTINARPERGSHLYIPVQSEAKSGVSDFLHFVDFSKGLSSEQIKQQIVVQNKINLNSNIELNNNLDVDVIFDPTVGDVLRVNGKGNIKVELDNDGVVNMFGNYEITKGDYLFTLSNLLNKRFYLCEGGKIIWAGSPFDATIDVDAKYSLKTSLNELLPVADGDEDKSGVERGKKVPVDCILHLSENILNPSVLFSINFPSVENQTKSYIESLFSSQDEINKQVFSLLLLNRFYRTEEEDNTYGEKASVASITSFTEMVTGQLSRWLSQISNNVDIGFSYRMGDDELTADEIEVALSTQLLNDRVTISANGNMDVGSKSTNTTKTNNIVGDFDVDVKLNNNGTLKLKAYSHTNEKLLYNNTETIQGIGVSYQENFDNLKELVEKYFASFRKRFESKKTL